MFSDIVELLFRQDGSRVQRVRVTKGAGGFSVFRFASWVVAVRSAMPPVAWFLMSFRYVLLLGVLYVSGWFVHLFPL
jgi:hypothetical protein